MMWFNNASVYQYELTDTPESFNESLEKHALKPCPSHSRFTLGWLPVHSDCYAHELTGFVLICMGKDERILPRGVIQKVLDERVGQLEDQEARSIKRAEKKQMAEDIEFELLPKSFSIIKKRFALIDTQNGRLIINTSSPNQAGELIAFLKSTLSGLQVKPLALPENLHKRFADWIDSPQALPQNFELGASCALFSPDNEKKQIQCKGYALPAEEVSTLLSKGLGASEIALIWSERIHLTLTESFVLKKIKCLDYLVDEFSEIKQLDEAAQQEDAALALLGGELRALLNDMISLLASKEKQLESEAV